MITFDLYMHELIFFNQINLTKFDYFVKFI